MESRLTSRYPIHYPSVFSGKKITGEGTVVDLSRSGCAVAGHVSLPLGTYVTLDIFLPDQDSPLVIDQAVVRWTVMRAFGLEFIRMGPVEGKRLHEFVGSLVTVPSH